MDQVICEKFLLLVDEGYTFFKNIGFDNPLEEAIESARKRIIQQYGELDKQEWDGLYLKAYSEYGPISVSKAAIMRSKKNIPWFQEKNPMYSYYWYRYEQYLKNNKNWSPETIATIDSTTNDILKSIGDPTSTKEFDLRGLVLGHVQSGKTANFTGLINKAFDVGYKLVIVLAGMHNDLRSQTQLRLEREVVGTVDTITGDKKGVAIIRNDKTLIETWTTVQEDISTNNTIGIKNLEKPILVVVKKQKDVLKRLIESLGTSVAHSEISPPVLIIDDEADQASVDSSGKNGEDPSKINQQIRELLNLFKQKSYVGYTATPFANLLIKADVNHNEIGKDLYPKDFAIALPKPNGYCGPDEYFNTTGYIEDDKPMFIRYLDVEDITVLNKMRKKDDANLFMKVPKSMEEAILSFLISIAIRNLRGQKGEHNSMLIHTSRFTDVQNSMCGVIEEFYKKLANDLLYNLKSRYIAKLKGIYENDFLEVQSSFEYSFEFPNFHWEEVYKEIKGVVSKVEVMEINGESEDALEYDKYKENGLYVIAIGGNKLSRGLTLEGLTISYYYRGSSMYDTLMQMGRWFGFRNGYMDLCRIYTSDEIAENFEYLVRVMSDLRKEFDKLAEEDITPEEYALRMLKHPTMKVTSPAKMWTAETLFNYAGTMQQTRSFGDNKEFYLNNMEATVRLINNIEQEFETKNPGGNGTKYHIAKNIPGQLIIDFLKDYQTLSSARIVDSKKIADYIIGMNREGFLEKFNVAIVDITRSTLKRQKTIENGITEWKVNFGKLSIESAVIRSIDRDKSKITGVVDLGAIVAADQEFVDIDIETKPKDKSVYKKLRANGNPLLLVYPLHPQVKAFKKLDVNFSEELVPIGLAFSFPVPDTVGADRVYISNSTVGEGVIND
ncbi:Z1 domain-containing protein [Bacillus pacificus]|uniref:Z1 domain-containing protein n=1 Tax=Bacillus TaxID=1386 RepID=UPI00034B141D|nr:Z1 domain-containing protein [Bacillus pacificus]MCC2419567.1 Z1 domain-containing protein [Bacillus pacificus]MCU5008816.1 Z1 domain-containing protein [Bacillus pacificus]MCU5259514.1 Z1 domain-containing protein [Bacillus pacificus]MCU5562034.1 Z1 domain-containing protein [Bacillus pacificus]HDR3524597.1 Z1 domain-containing protein [Bacillus pacificus]